ncbi:MAG: GIY-YIG nuclease family protein [Paludibacter sp.]
MTEAYKKPYTIKLFMPDGNPNTFKIINKMNWTGVGLEVSREVWENHRSRKEFDQAGVYVLIGYTEDSDLPTIYIGQGDGVRNRINKHFVNKMFWDKVLVFISSNGGLNRAHITWIEWALINKAKEFDRCLLDNNAVPNEPVLTESEKADTTEFLNEMLSVLPLVEIKVFDKPRKIDVDEVFTEKIPTKANPINDTVVVPAQEDGFKEVFLGENCWYAIRIGGGMLNEIKYIAAYQSAPISAITHYAEVDTIEAYGDGGKYKLNFKSAATQIEPIKFGNAKTGSLQSTRYTSFEKLMKAKSVKELFG